MKPLHFSFLVSSTTWMSKVKMLRTPIWFEQEGCRAKSERAWKNNQYCYQMFFHHCYSCYNLWLNFIIDGVREPCYCNWIFNCFFWDVRLERGWVLIWCHMCMHVRFEMFVIVIYLPVSFKVVPTSKGQALADEYGIKFFETVSGVYQKMWKPLNFFVIVLMKNTIAECKDKSKCWGSFLLNSKRYKTKVGWHWLQGRGIWTSCLSTLMP